jgi:hypothetical protein
MDRQQVETGDEEAVHMLMGDEILRDHDRSIPLDQGPSINPLAAPPVLGSTYTVTVANPTPPTNISYVAAGTPPMYTMVPNPAGRGAPAYSDDCVLVPIGGLVPPEGKSPTSGQVAAATGSTFIPSTAVALTAIATPAGGSSGPTSEATGTVVVVTSPGSVAAAPTQMISVQGNFTSTPNASHASYSSQIGSLSPFAPVSTASGGTPATLELAVNGRGFNSTSVVTVAAVAQTTILVNPQTLRVAAAPRKAAAGISTVSVTTDSVVSTIMNWNFS